MAVNRMGGLGGMGTTLLVGKSGIAGVDDGQAIRIFDDGQMCLNRQLDFSFRIHLFLFFWASMKSLAALLRRLRHTRIFTSRCGPPIGCTDFSTASAAMDYNNAEYAARSEAVGPLVMVGYFSSIRWTAICSLRALNIRST